jgi:hypothetical protein
MCADIGALPAVWFDSIFSGNREFKLYQEMKVPVSLCDGLFVLETKAVPIVAYGESLSSAIVDFQEQFAVLWDRIAKESDDKLTLDAQSAKRSQLNIVESVSQSA